ncbi:MAG TPA: hypothetical protein VJH97_04250 [Candidatus Nanoarchaeia archaeon]|nr:hypothetical protein [Candidatus Nanoarchaeia archaeon]
MGIHIASSILFLGTGTDPYVVGKGLRSAGGIVIQVNDNQFHLDPGPGSLQMAKAVGINLRAHTSLLVSSNDLYLCSDLNLVIDAMTYSGFDKKGVLLTTKSVLNGTDGFVLSTLHRDFLERYIAMQPGQRVGINDIEIEALKTTNTLSIGFKIFTSSFTLAYTSLTKYSPEVAEQYKDCGILIVNFADPHSGLGKDGVVKLLNWAQPRLAVLTGFGNKMIEADPLYIAREIQKETGIQTIAARDGMVLNPASYAAQEGQRTFGTFSADEKKVRIIGSVAEPAAESEEQPKDQQKTLTIEESDHTPENNP